MSVSYVPDFDSIAKIAAPLLVALIGGIVRHYLRERPRLIYYFVHSASLPLPQMTNADGTPEEPSGQRSIHTHAIVVRNVGNKTATKVRIAHDIFPHSHRLHPMVHYTVERGQEASAEIVLPALVPNEQVTISYLYPPSITWNQVGCYVKSEEGLARGINVLPSPPIAKPLVVLIWAMIFLGASTSVYWIFQALAAVLQL